MKELSPYLEKWNLSNIERFSKYQWRNVINKRVYELNRYKILEWSQSYKKLDYTKLSSEKFEVKEYFKSMNIHDCRLYFKIQSLVTPTIRSHFKSDKKFKAEKWICIDCRTLKSSRTSSDNDQNETVEVLVEGKRYIGNTDTIDHLNFQCSANKDLRRGKDVIGNAQDCVQFFRQVIQRRLNNLS